MDAEASPGRVRVESRSDQWPWGDCESEPIQGYPTIEPQNPIVGMRWYDATEQIIYVWDGDEWLQVPED